MVILHKFVQSNILFKVERFFKPGLLKIYLITLLTVVPGHVCSLGGVEDIPENSHIKTYSRDEWECEREYYAIDNKCDEIEVPANGYLLILPWGPVGSVNVVIKRQESPVSPALGMVGNVIGHIGGNRVNVFVRHRSPDYLYS